MELCLDFNTPLTGVAQAQRSNGLTSCLPPPPTRTMLLTQLFIFFFPSPELCNLISAAEMWFLWVRPTTI